MRIRIDFSVLFALSAASVFGQVMPQNFYPVSPCRAVDTRMSGGGGPLAAKATRSFSLQGACGIPASATAYSLNVTVIPTGSSLQYLTIYPTGQSQPVVSTLNDGFGKVIANAAIVTAGTSGDVSVYVTDSTNVLLDINGYFVDQTVGAGENTALGTGSGSGGSGNTGIGYSAISNGTGSDNTATGGGALEAASSGGSNVAYGYQALALNKDGSYNSALGVDALSQNNSGADQVAIGNHAMYQQADVTGSIAIGSGAMGDHATAGNNDVGVGLWALSGLYNTDNMTAIGFNSLAVAGSGANDIALGQNAGTNVEGGTNVIEIGNSGGTNDSGLILIGTAGTQSKTTIAGVYGIKVTGGSAVMVNSSGQLGVQSSSIRYKEDVHDMGDASAGLLDLRPVTFRYKEASEGVQRPEQYGLIAEEVEQVYPDLVSYDAKGEVNSVQYHQLPAMILNEYQKEHREVEQLLKKLQELEAARR